MSGDLKERLLQQLDGMPRGLAAHVQRARKEIGELARRFGVDEETANLAALAHDVARHIEGERLIALAAGFGIPVLPIERAVPVLLHGPVGAEILARELGVQESELLEATRIHTSGKGGMSLLSKVVFLGDKLDPTKEGMYPFIARVRELAKRDLDAALLAFLNANIMQLLQQGHPIHPYMLEARNELLMTKGHSQHGQEQSCS